MTTQRFLDILTKHRATLATAVALGAIAGLLASAAIPIRYRSSMELIILQRYAFARDAYTASRSIEYLSNVFGEVVFSQSFIDDVLASGFRIENKFSPEPGKRKKQWKRIVSSRVNRDTGTISIAVLHRSPDQAQQIAQAILHVLNTNGDNYHGEGDRVTIRTLDAPFVASRPAQPNIPANALAGAMVALAAAFTIYAAGREFELTPSAMLEWFGKGPRPNPAPKAAPEPAAKPQTPFYAHSPFVFERQPQYATAPAAKHAGSPLQSSNTNTIPGPTQRSEGRGRGEAQELKTEIGFRAPVSPQKYNGKSVAEIKKQMLGHPKVPSPRGEKDRMRE